jgi:hypothetical protein
MCLLYKFQDEQLTSTLRLAIDDLFFICIAEARSAAVASTMKIDLSFILK